MQSEDISSETRLPAYSRVKYPPTTVDELWRGNPQFIIPMTPPANIDKGGLDSSKYANSTEPTPQPTPTSHGNEQPEREAQLRAELEGLKRVNEVIEGVISSLDRAKAGMDVCSFLQADWHNADTVMVVRQRNNSKRTRPPRHLHPHPESHRTQPAPNPQPGMGRRQCRRRRCGE